MRFEIISIAPGITQFVPYLECWRCGDNVLETDISLRDLCRRCERLAEEGFISVSVNEDDDWD